MRILVDTDVLVDFVVKRKSFSNNAGEIIEQCVNKRVQGCIAAHTIPNLFYILRKDLAAEKRRLILLNICKIFTVVGIDAIKLESALRNNDFTDFEDCLQTECAKEFGADFIITRNVKDFVGSAVPAIEPAEFAQKY